MQQAIFDCTAYWPQVLKAGETGEALTVEFGQGGMMTVLVDPEDLQKAKVEASAILDLSELGPHAGTISLSYLGGDEGWKSYPWAPYGVGSKDNALCPWRDVASNHLPFGTCIVLAPPQDFPYLRGRLYVADRFGSEQEPERLDLFFMKPAEKFRRTFFCRFYKPPQGFSESPTRGAQQILNKLGYRGANGLVLKEDGIFGPQTRNALLSWRSEWCHLFLDGIPERFRPEDPEVYFWLRMTVEMGAGEDLWPY